MMQRVLFVFAMMLCVAAAFVQPGVLKTGSPKLTAPVTRADSPTMMVEAEAAVSAVSSIGLTVAAAAGDFGGYTIPIIGLGVLAATISLLAGPVDE